MTATAGSGLGWPGTVSGQWPDRRFGDRATGSGWPAS